MAVMTIIDMKHLNYNFIFEYLAELLIWLKNYLSFYSFPEAKFLRIGVGSCLITFFSHPFYFCPIFSEAEFCDLGSSHGSLLNQQPVVKSRLCNGDVLTLGNSILTVMVRRALPKFDF